jgi:hypothetical protein
MTFSGPWRRAPVTGPYLELEMPKVFRVDFLTERGTWMKWGLFRAAQVKRRPDCSCILHSDGSPFFIHCIADFGHFFLHIDGNARGEPFLYRLVESEPKFG